MATWKTRGLRGSAFESIINSTNEYYRSRNLALVQKIPTPITPLKFDSERKLITEAYFEKDSTVDYIGVVQEIPICFDAKECKTDTFSLQNIHEHQFKFMEDFERQGGVAFLLILFTERNDMYYMRFSELKTYVERVNEGHAKNFKYIELDDDYFLRSDGPAMVHYLEGLNRDIQSRDKEDD
jgi:recombination protein U